MASVVSDLGAYVKQKAPGFGLDPAAVLAVASQEGAGGGIGDSGTSFGPWQLHYGGAYPSSAPHQSAAASQAWAWSPAGVDYALAAMGKVAGGQQGATAIDSIVSRFERPANPGAEIAAADKAYASALLQTGSGFGGLGPAPGSVAGQTVSAVGGAVSTLTGTVTSVADATKFLFSYRFLEILGGGALILVGLYILAQQFKQTALAQAIPLPGPAKEAAASTGLTPEVRERREARTEEVHQVRVKTEKARATELRTRTKHRRLAKAEQTKEINRAYIRGAAETSPLR